MLHTFKNPSHQSVYVTEQVSVEVIPRLVLGGMEFNLPVFL